MTKYPMPMSRYLRQKQEPQQVQKAERNKQFNAADKLSPSDDKRSAEQIL